MTTKNQINRPLTFSKVDHCPECHRKLCCRRKIEGTDYVHFKHKGSDVYANEMIVRCLGCKRQFVVTADNGLIDEVNIGNNTIR